LNTEENTSMRLAQSALTLNEGVPVRMAACRVHNTDLTPPRDRDPIDAGVGVKLDWTIEDEMGLYLLA
jgi:hypothetical protein